MMRRLVLLTQFFPPETTPGARRAAAMARALSQHFTVTVVTLQPSYPSPDLYASKPQGSGDSGRGSAAGGEGTVDRLPPAFDVVRGPVFHPHKGGLLWRGLREQLMSLRLLRLASAAAPALVLATSPSMFLGPAGWLLARRRHAPFIWDVRDLTWRYAREHGPASWPARCASSCLESYMWAILRRADLVVGANQGIIDVLIGKGLPAAKCLVVPNGIAAGFLRATAPHQTPRPPAVPAKVTYVGLLGLNQGLRSFVEAAAQAPEADFVLAGDGPERPLLEAEAQRLKLSNVVWKGYLREGQVLQAYYESDILFAQLRDRPALDAAAFPSKLFEYLAAGRPIVYAGKGQAARFMEESGAAMVIPPEEPAAIAQAVRGLLADPARREQMGRAGRKHVEEHHRQDTIMAHFAEQLAARWGMGR
jgi:glycosyltransferase involved in cell wall biosynthesis